MRRDFLKALQVYVARGSTGASTLRGQPAGTLLAAREFLSVIPLKQFGIERASLFYSRLDSTTESLRRKLPRGAQTFEVSRKVFNIFLRNAFYISYLREQYRLEAAESLLEVPLDSITAARLHACDTWSELPRWKGVKYLMPEQNRIYQVVARRVAKQKRIAPVHLDTYWWGGDRVAQAG
jgi:N-glycosylase/DNA lyase